jgi:ribosomal protein S18 acetylase RimI-like enzyme
LSVDRRIQQSVVTNLSARPAAVEAGPFVLGIDPATDNPNINYATPRPGAAITASDVETLVGAFRSAGRKPRLEYVVSCAPGLEPLLVAAGFTVEARHEFLTCSPATLVEPAPQLAHSERGAGFELREPERGAGFELREPATRDELAAMMAAQREAFGDEGEVTDADVDRLEESQQRGAVALTAITGNGVCAGGGQAVPPNDRVSEIGGIAVRAPYRRRGLGGAITAGIARRLFEAGADLAWLEASGDDSWRVYERIGFRPAGRRLYISL